MEGTSAHTLCHSELENLWSRSSNSRYGVRTSWSDTFCCWCWHRPSLFPTSTDCIRCSFVSSPCSMLCLPVTNSSPSLVATLPQDSRSAVLSHTKTAKTLDREHPFSLPIDTTGLREVLGYQVWYRIRAGHGSVLCFTWGTVCCTSQRLGAATAVCCKWGPFTCLHPHHIVLSLISPLRFYSHPYSRELFSFIWKWVDSIYSCLPSLLAQWACYFSCIAVTYPDQRAKPSIADFQFSLSSHSWYCTHNISMYYLHSHHMMYVDLSPSENVKTVYFSLIWWLLLSHNPGPYCDVFEACIRKCIYYCAGCILPLSGMGDCPQGCMVLSTSLNEYQYISLVLGIATQCVKVRGPWVAGGDTRGVMLGGKG